MSVDWTEHLRQTAEANGVDPKSAAMAARLAHVGHVVVDRVGNLTGVVYAEQVTWSDGLVEMVTRCVPRERMPQEDVEACEWMLSMRTAPEAS